MPHVDPEARKAYAREYYRKKLSDKLKAERRAQGIGPRNPPKTDDERRAYHREWNKRDRERDPSKQRAVSKRSREKHFEKRSAENRAYERANPDKVRGFRRATRYGITCEQVEQMLEAQAGACAICLRPIPVPAIDHCHATGKVRGLLCRPCNSGLGMFQDNTESLSRAIEYLNRAQGV